MDSDPFSIQNFRETRTHIIGMQSKIYPSLWQASNIKLYFQTRYRVCLEQIERLNELPQSTSEAREQVESMGEDDARTLGKHKNLEDKLDSAAFLDSRLKEFARPLTSENLIQITNGTFYLQHPKAEDKAAANSNPPLFRDLSFELPAKPLNHSEDGRIKQQQHWAVIGASGTTTFLEILRGTHLCFPPTARSFPYLSSDEIEAKDHRLRTPFRAIQSVGFNAGRGQGLGGGIRGAYLSARYESRREDTDWSVLQYLKGETDLNPAEDQHAEDREDSRLLAQVMKDLRLEKMSDMPVSNLSNGQTRRARIARALLGKPELLLLDEPFMGLDPPTLVTLSPMLRELAYKSSPRLLLALRPQDPIPDWITHLVILGSNHTVALMGSKDDVLFALHRWADAYDGKGAGRYVSKMARKMTQLYGKPLLEVGHILTSTGITRYDTYEKVLSSTSPRYFNEWGIVDTRYLSRTDKKAFEPFRHQQPRSWTVHQLLNMTATLPAIFKNKDVLGADSHDKIARRQTTVETEQSPQSNTPSVRNSADSAAALKQASSISAPSLGEPLIELSGAVVKYGSKTVLGHPPAQIGYTEPGLHLTIRENTRLALLGPNGSGKTTLLSLLTSDHPHSYSLPIKFFGRSRLPEAGKLGLSLWDIQSRIGHSSPEIHAFFPKALGVRRVLESAWAETFSGKPKLSFERDEIVNSVLRWWEPELRQSRRTVTSAGDGNAMSNGVANKQMWMPGYTKSPLGELVLESYPEFIRAEQSESKADEDLEWAENKRTHAFGVLPFGTQRLLLLLRAMIKSPDIVVLDEAFSGLSPEVREKAMCFLEHGETMFLQRRKASDEHGPSQLVRVPNMRLTVEHVLAHRNVSLPTALGLTSKGKELQAMTREEQIEVADIEAAKNGVSGYRFTGLSDKQALVVVSHVREEVPGIVNEWLRLPGEEEVIEEGRGVEMGRCDDGSIRTVEGWGKVWGF